MNNFELIAQGAEARVYKGIYLGKPTLIKERFEKKYRHADLDKRLTKDRIKAECRAIIRAKAAGKIIISCSFFKNKLISSFFFFKESQHQPYIWQI